METCDPSDFTCHVRLLNARIGFSHMSGTLHAKPPVFQRFMRSSLTSYAEILHPATEQYVWTDAKRIEICASAPLSDTLIIPVVVPWTCRGCTREAILNIDPSYVPAVRDMCTHIIIAIGKLHRPPKSWNHVLMRLSLADPFVAYRIRDADESPLPVARTSP